MKTSQLNRDWRALDESIEAFEIASRRDPSTPLEAFLPNDDHPQYAEILLELVRVDLEQRWERGEPRPLDDYLARHGRWLKTTAAVEQIAFEEYRARRRAGQQATPDDYRRRYGVSTDQWPVGVATGGKVEALSPFPEVGADYLGFELLAEIGRGALSRVYLARQGDLAQRLVALKVSTTSWAEADKLAQLQHANIVPVYSVHSDGPRCAVCMPYHGSATLADVLRNVQRSGTLPVSGLNLLGTLSAKADQTWLAASEGKTPAGAVLPASQSEKGRPEAAVASAALSDLKKLGGLSYVEAVLWLGARLADGLSHAHQRGIVHRDLKPANILLADDGRPMLLDFNLSEDVKRSSDESVVGGTLPYMSPEQIAAFQRRGRATDLRSDVYSLGVILFELLCGKAPFPLREGTLDQRVSASLSDRLGAIPEIQSSAAGVTPAIRAIVRHCLAPQPENRYQSAEQLRDDLQRQLDHLPLQHAADRSPVERTRKWVRRHPRVTSVGGVAAMALAAILLVGGAAVVRQQRLDRLQSGEELRALQQALDSARIESLQSVLQGHPTPEALLAKLNRVLDKAQAPRGDAWVAIGSVRQLSAEQIFNWRTSLGELWELTAAVAQSKARRVPDDQRLQLLQQAEDCARYAAAAYPAPSPDQRGLTGQRTADTAREMGRAALQFSLERRFDEALPLWQQTTAADPRQVWAWYALAACQSQLERWPEAIASFTACIALAPEFAEAYAGRGTARYTMQEFVAAETDFDRAIQLAPNRADNRINHALALLGQGRAAEAHRELTAAIQNDPAHGRLYHIRAQTRQRLEDTAGAAADQQAALRCIPRDDPDWIARGIAQLPSDPEAALVSFAEAAGYNPGSLAARVNQAHVLSERLGRTEEALDLLDDAVRDFPYCETVYAARGVLLARLGRRDAAIEDARRALDLRDSPATRYHLAGIYSQTAASHPLDKFTALALLASALGQGFGENLLEVDVDLNPLRADEQFQALVQAARLLKSAAQVAPLPWANTQTTAAARTD